MRRMPWPMAFALAVVATFVAGVDPAAASDMSGMHPPAAGRGARMGPAPGGLLMPMMDPARGRKIFAAKGCVVCHAMNGIGGEDGPRLDMSAMGPMNPFEFAAKMWRGAEAMIVLQREELGEPIELNGQDLADIIAFVHSPAEVARFSEADVPRRILDVIEKAHGEGGGHHHNAESGSHHKK